MSTKLINQRQKIINKISNNKIFKKITAFLIVVCINCLMLYVSIDYSHIFGFIHVKYKL